MTAPQRSQSSGDDSGIGSLRPPSRDRFIPKALLYGGAVTGVLCLTFAFLGSLSNDSGALTGPWAIAFLFGGCIGGVIAARMAPGDPLPHGAAAAASGYAAAQLGAYLIALVRGSNVRAPEFLAIAYLFVTMASLGTIGAMLYSRFGSRPRR